uniref:Transcriptional regulator n=1 Tax=uncultured soil bacterium TaxID=164851 RepID=E2D2I3_9BACT|nr:transcriptional regulator [uncultured soil bacterium]
MRGISTAKRRQGMKVGRHLRRPVVLPVFQQQYGTHRTLGGKVCVRQGRVEAHIVARAQLHLVPVHLYAQPAGLHDGVLGPGVAERLLPAIRPELLVVDLEDRVAGVDPPERAQVDPSPLSTSTSSARTTVSPPGGGASSRSDTGIPRALDRLNTVSIVGLPLPDSSCESVAFPIPERRDSSESDSPCSALARLRLAASISWIEPIEPVELLWSLTPSPPSPSFTLSNEGARARRPP